MRYVIVYNDVFKLTYGRREIEVMIDERQFNEEGLTSVFNLIKNRFPSPKCLSIEVHTNLATIETPEEREKPDDNEGRLTDQTFLNKTASFTRNISGRESFIYSTSLSPYETKRVVLVDKQIKPPGIIK